MFSKNNDYDEEMDAPLTVGGSISRCAICGGEPTFRNRWNGAFAKCMICGNGFEIYKSDFEKPKALPSDKRYELITMWNAKQIANVTFLKANDWTRDADSIDISGGQTEILKGLRSIKMDLSDNRTEIVNSINLARNSVIAETDKGVAAVTDAVNKAVTDGCTDIIFALAGNEEAAPAVPAIPEEQSRIDDFDSDEPVVKEDVTLTAEDIDTTPTVTAIAEEKTEVGPAESVPTVSEIPDLTPEEEKIMEEYAGKDDDSAPSDPDMAAPHTPFIVTDGVAQTIPEDTEEEKMSKLRELLAKRNAVNPDAPDSVPAVSEPRVLTEGDDRGDETADGKAAEPASELTEVKEEEVIVPVEKDDELTAESESEPKPEPEKDDELVKKEEPVTEAPEQQTPANPLEGLSLDQIQSYLKDLLEKKSN